MNFEDRISRLQAAGTITPAQADAMREGIQENIATKSGLQHRKLPLFAIVVIMIAVAIILLFMVSGNDSSPETIQHISETMNEAGKVGAMSKGMTTGISLVVIMLPIILSVIGFVWLHNDLVGKEEDVLASWSQVESNYQRRADLIPNLVKTVKTFMQHEKDVLTQVTQERNTVDWEQAVQALTEAQNKASKLNSSATEKLDDEAFMRTLATAQKSVGQQISRLFGVVENYPQLRSGDNFLALQDQLEGTENRINVARMVFNDSVRDYNSAIRKMPGTLIAGLGGFKRKAYFEAEESAGEAVEVDFK